jgi:hypothetical protein
MRVTKDGKYIFYHPSAEAANIIDSWPGGAVLDWDVDDEDRHPRAIRLTPATPGNGLSVRKYYDRPFISLPTSAVGVARYRRPVDVEESVSPCEIVVGIQFEFRIHNVQA